MLVNTCRCDNWWHAKHLEIPWKKSQRIGFLFGLVWNVNITTLVTQDTPYSLNGETWLDLTQYTITGTNFSTLKVQDLAGTNLSDFQVCGYGVHYMAIGNDFGRLMQYAWQVRSVWEWEYV